ncbi:coenzyme F420:NADP oxidoreductase, partial [Methanosalsum natronophilum]
MKIAIIGGTGNIGKGFAVRWGSKHEIIVGSRDKQRAENKALEYANLLKDRNMDALITGNTNLGAASEAEVIILAVRYSKVESIIEQLKPVLDRKIIVSVVVPMEKNQCTILPDSDSIQIEATSREDFKADYFCYMTPKLGSAAEEIDAMLPEGIELVSAFHNVPAAKLANLDLDLDYDIGVCGN